MAGAADIGPDPGSEDPLGNLIDDQTAQATAIPVLLFTSATLTAGNGPAAANEAGATEEVNQVAGALGLDVGELELFSLDAYRLQCELALAFLPGRR